LPLAGLARSLVPIVSRISNSNRVPILCYVTDRQILSKAIEPEPREALLRRIETAVAAGVDWIQIREQDLSGKECAALTSEALQRAARQSTSKESSARILVNDRLDIALSQGAGGVHLGENSLPVKDVRKLVDARNRAADFLIGVSCHSLEAATAATKGGANYIFFGPIFATPSKTAYGAPQGLARLAEVCRAVSLPIVAIGGVTLANAASCLSAGASGIAAIRLFQDAQDLLSLVKILRTQKG
jgi:thiamine-phosphate pyrophosphorylase